ncbi:MAG: LysR family transcriptional regulator, partial [Bdellovibrionia bacterium]
METISRRIEDLLAFHSVAIEGGFTAAANSLATSKALLSKQVQRLEAHLGVDLFKRSTRSVRLTDEGVALLEYTRRIFALSEEAGKKLRELQSGEQGLVRISTTVS